MLLRCLIGTTKKGISPCYTDKVSRKALKLFHLQSKELLKNRLEETLSEVFYLLDHFYKIERPSLNEEVDSRLKDTGLGLGFLLL